MKNKYDVYDTRLTIISIAMDSILIAKPDYLIFPEDEEDSTKDRAYESRELDLDDR